MDPYGDEAALLRSVHASRGDTTPRLVYADYLDDAGRPQEAAMHRYIADPSERHRDALIAAHGGRASDAANALSGYVSQRAYMHDRVGELIPGHNSPWEIASLAALQSRRGQHDEAAYTHAAGKRASAPIKMPGFYQRLPAETVQAHQELLTLHTAAHKLHQHAAEG